MRCCCSATVATTALGVVLQLAGTLCFALVVAVISCDDIPFTCWLPVAQPCVIGATITRCQELIDEGCDAEQLHMTESCQLQFGCGHTRRMQSESGAVVGCGSQDSEPCPHPVASSQQTSEESASGFGPDLCAVDERASSAMVFTVSGGVALILATPILGCQAQGIVGCGARADSSGFDTVARKAWLLYIICAICYLLYVLSLSSGLYSAALGFDFSIDIPILVGVSIVMTLGFDVASALMCWTRRREECISSEAYAAPAAPLVVISATP